MMSSGLVISILCAVAVNVFSREITRPKRHNFKFEDGWDWALGYVEGNVPIIPNPSFSYSVKIVAVPGIEYFFGPEINPFQNFHTNIFTSIRKPVFAPETTPTPATPTITSETKPIDVPLTSKIKTIIAESSTISTTKSSSEDSVTNSSKAPNTANKIQIIASETTTIPATPANEPITFSTEIKTTDVPFTSKIETVTAESSTISTTKIIDPAIYTTEETTTLIPSTIVSKPSENTTTSTTRPPILIKTVDSPLAEIRLANLTEETPRDSITETTTEITTETTTEIKQTESTTKKERDLCDPLPKKPDFSAPERRINEEQCMGYVWDMKNRVEQKKWDLLCVGQKFVNHAVGGRKTEIGEFPHMGAIGWKAAVGTWVFKCGSSLISANFVLTAAHCTKASDKDSSIADPVPKIVRLGDKNIVDKKTFFTFPTDANITNILVHPQYHGPTQYYDIALMELEEPVEFTRFIQPACLWNSFSTGEPEHEATLTGWGVIESGSRDFSPELQAATVNVLDTAQCDKLLKDSHNRNWKGFKDHQLCAGKLAGGVDSCQGDSGGPLQMEMPLPNHEEGKMHYIIGVISFGVGCAHPKLPGVYTRVSSFVNWIEDNVWKNGHNRTYVAPPSNIIFLK